LRKFLEFFSVENGLSLIFGDSVLSAERLKDFKDRDPYSFKSLNFRVATIPSLVIDMRRDPREGARSPILSEEILEMIGEAREKGKNTFIFSARKGLSSVTVCRDCGTEVLCKNCASPVVLYKGMKGNVFRCHQCGEARSAEEVCVSCSSWRLLPLGIGTERIKEELDKILPEVKVFEINKEATSTPSKARRIAEKFYGSPGSVLIGTEMALNYLYEPVDFSVVASIDSLFVVPDYHIREKVLRLLLGVKLLALDRFIIQLRNAERETIDMALSGNILEFYNREIKEREELNYPPFSIFVKITSRGPRQNVTEEMSRIAYILGKYQPTIFPSVSEKRGAQYAENAVIKIERYKWPDNDLILTLKALPPVFEVKVSPDNLL
jgi:primosomal protein N' (replication factor Y)